MSSSIAKFLLLISLSSIILSCKYVPTGSNEVSLQIPVSDINIVILDESGLNSLRGNVKIPYNAMIGEKEVRSIRVQINGQTISSSTDGGYIFFSTLGFPDGPCTLSVELITSSNSGSIADHLGAEGFRLVKEYQAYVFNGTVNPSVISGFAVANGSLNITWSKYVQPGFQRYVLRQNDYVRSIIAVITDVNVTQFADTSFLGRLQVYRLETVVAGTAYGGNTTTTYFDSPVMTLSANSDSNSVSLRWTKNSFYSAFKSYRVRRHHMSGYVHEDYLSDIHLITDTTYVDPNPIIGGGTEYVIEGISKTGTSVDLCTATSGAMGKSVNYFGPASHFDYLSQKNVFFHYWNKHCYLLDGTSMTVIRSVDVPNDAFNDITIADASQNGEFIYCISGAAAAEIKQLDPVSLQTVRTVNLNTINGSSVGSIQGISVSNSGLLCVTVNSHPTQTKLYVVDPDQGRIIANISTDISAYNLQVSKNGTYIINGTNLYSYKDSVLTSVSSVSANAKFLPGDDQFVQSSGFTIQVKNCIDGNVAKVIPIPVSYGSLSVEVDQSEGLVGCESQTGYYYILDITAGQIKKTIPVQIWNSIYGFRFQKKNLFWNGRRMEIGL